jgi:phosphoribosylamine--glycine ligase
VSDPAAVLALAAAEAVDLTVIGPELPLALGVQDLFSSCDRLLFGPSQVAAQLESSKAFAKDFMARYQVPTARFRVCERADEALAAVAGPEFGFPVVIKADGLAAGKGVTVAPDRATAEQAVRDSMVDHRFGTAGHRVVIEECLVGDEASFFAICDGQEALGLPTAQDHKRAFDGDTGPNTGGMGAFAPSPLVTPEIERRVRREIVRPVLDGLARDGHPYQGFLYVGLMITANGPQVIEFNVRLGDPEAQVVLPMVRDELAPLLEAAARGALKTTSCDQTRAPHVGVVLASGGYPGVYETGAPIAGLDAASALEGVLVFHAGTGVRGDSVVTTGGRVLTVVGRGLDVAEAIERAYAAEALITFARKQVRTDIGSKALDISQSATP